MYLADANKNADVQQFYSHFSTNWFSESDQENLAYVPTNCCFHVDCRNDDNSRFFDGKELGRTTYPDENPAGFQVGAAASQSAFIMFVMLELTATYTLQKTL